jgi:hypothetical protein
MLAGRLRVRRSLRGGCIVAGSKGSISPPCHKAAGHGGRKHKPADHLKSAMASERCFQSD